MFSNYKEIEHGFMCMANSKNCNVIGIGDVCLRFSSGFEFTLKNVRHVPELRYNLLSCASLEDVGLEEKWEKGVKKIRKGSLVILTVVKKNNLLGHKSDRRLEILYNRSHLNSDNLPTISLGEPYVLKNQLKVRFVDDAPSEVEHVPVISNEVEMI
ncbi:hypothetical protein LIER_02183 [Lithospermum erythrorhizon]|uniref:Retrovirus-related Pol polyprotein from transposon TNT 1-94-like beta-barrel domain-containing protein n=1 Tax=Lithospermum erythrorhizon TaxID=34254 RepID=A0AAV3NNK3_LITER